MQILLLKRLNSSFCNWLWLSSNMLTINFISFYSTSATSRWQSVGRTDIPDAGIKSIFFPPHFIHFLPVENHSLLKMVLVHTGLENRVALRTDAFTMCSAFPLTLSEWDYGLAYASYNSKSIRMSKSFSSVICSQITSIFPHLY